MKTLKATRTVTYRRYGIPALILEGKWLTEKYRLQIGDHVDIDYQQNEIRLRKNNKLSVESRKKIKQIESIRQLRIQQIKQPLTTYDDQSRNKEASEEQGDEHR
jgi:hypothetical protein